MLPNVTPPSWLTCHWTRGVGRPIAATVKTAVAPTATACGAGSETTASPGVTVSVAEPDGTEAATLVNTARYRDPLSAAAGRKEKVVAVAPGMSAKVVP